MAKYRTSLPHLDTQIIFSCSGLETTILFQKNIDIPCFAVFPLLEREEGYQILYEWLRSHAQLFQSYNKSMILLTPTWRGNLDWALKLGYTPQTLVQTIKASVNLPLRLREEFQSQHIKVLVEGQLGPRADAYNPEFSMTPQEAQQYHSLQVNAFSQTPVDYLGAYTLGYADEAIGFVKAAQAVNIPICISFTLQTDGKLPDGTTLQEAIMRVDTATNNGPLYYLINCSHPSHFREVLNGESPYLRRVFGTKCNASKKSHAQLDESTELDSGDPVELGVQVGEMNRNLEHFNILGGCCGTNIRHIEEIIKCCSRIDNL